MDDLIQVINRVRDALAPIQMSLPIDLPQIAVVGGQSAGKSSVLESFVGRDFLPRGSGVVTRRPLILQLINDAEEYGEFGHLEGRRFLDFHEIRDEIERETDRVSGRNKAISPDPISLTIHSPRVVNLTLIDLPGLARVPVGDQPQDIEHQIREMILSYISRSNCLILAVTSANQDLATSDALTLAKAVDPGGERTIGVLTKLDLMDQGTDAMDILTGKLHSLKRGYIGVVNRSQRAIDNSQDIRETLEREHDFFQTHPAYKGIASKLGTGHLQHVLSEQLRAHIRKTLPDLKDTLRRKLTELDVGESDVWDMNSFRNKNTILNQIISRLRSDFESTVEGKDWDELDTENLTPGAQIQQLFTRMLPEAIQRVKSDDDRLRHQISIAIQNAPGFRAGLFTPDSAFSVVVKKELNSFAEPAIDCLELVVQQLIEAAKKCIDRITRFS